VKRYFGLLLCALLVCGLCGGLAQARGAAVEHVLIGFNGVSDVALIEAAGGTVRYAYDIVPAVAATLPAGAAAALARNPRVAYVEPDGLVWAMAQTLPWGIDRVGADHVWPSGNKGAGVKACVIDTGIDMDHPDLTVRGGYDFVNSDSNPDDDNGHGTHVAGIIAALDNTIGVVGCAPDCYLYAAKVLNASGSGTISQVVAGIDWARNNGMKIVNMSLGTSTSYATLKTACDNAWAAGLILVAPSGGSGAGTDTVGYPAKYASVICVGATDQSNVRASFSSTGPTLELAAPGVSIYSTYRSGGYQTMSGTSMACPHVAGVAALVWYAQPGVSNQHVRDAMDYTALDLGSPGRDSWYGYGLVQAPAAVAY